MDFQKHQEILFHILHLFYLRLLEYGMKQIYFQQNKQEEEKKLFKNKIKAVEAGANGTLEYTIKEGVNKGKIADDKILKNKN